MRKYLLGLCLVIPAIIWAADVVNGPWISRDGQAVSINDVLDVSDMERFSLQVAMSTRTFSTASVIDGVKSYASITLPASTTTMAGTSIYINGVRLIAGTDFAIGTSTPACAKNISDAIMANTTLNAIIVSTHTASPLAIVSATATAVGINAYSLSATTTAIILSAPYFSGGKESEIDFTADTLYEPSHGLSVAVPVLLGLSGTIPTGLTDKATYYVIPAGANYLQLAHTSTGAAAGSSYAMNITTVTGSSTITLTPLGWLAGACGYTVTGSNDGTTYWTVANSTAASPTLNAYIPTVLFSTAAVSNVYFFNPFPYRYIKFATTKPDRGGVDVDVTLSGKRVQ